MAHGPGKYDEHATRVREETEARGVIVMVFDGKHGTGFSVQSDSDVLLNLPQILETMAKGIRADVKAGLDG